MISLLIFTLFTATVSGAVIYRMRGGWPSWPRPIEQMFYCTVFAFALVALGVHWGGVLVGYAAAVGFVLAGHGQWFLRKFVLPHLEAIEPERFDFLLRPFFGEDPRTAEKYAKWRGFDPKQDPEEYGLTVENWQAALKDIDRDVDEYGRRKLFWRCVAGLAMSGGIVSLVPGIILMFWAPFAGLGIALAGFTKGPVYLVSYWLGWGTEGGEFGAGGVLWFLVTAITLAALIL